MGKKDDLAAKQQETRENAPPPAPPEQGSNSNPGPDPDQNPQQGAPNDLRDSQAEPDQDQESQESSEEKSEEDVFAEQQANLAATQNAQGAVPEQRPQAFATANDSESDLTKRLKEADDPLVTDKPMDKDAYDRAGSDEQREKADEASLTPTIREGTMVYISKSGPHVGRAAVVQRVNYTKVGQIVRDSGRPEAEFAEVDTITVKTRDGRTDLLELKPDEVTEADPATWGKTSLSDPVSA